MLSSPSPAVRQSLRLSVPALLCLAAGLFASAETTPAARAPEAAAAETWLNQSFIDDPANLKHERPAARDSGVPLPVDQGRSGLEQMLRRLGTRASLLMIVAHPDDEDGGMLTYVSRGLGARVGILTLTRGEGGQNVMSGDFDDALGLVRTRELLAADRYFAADQMFGTEADFGFSKTIAEAFNKWTHERVLFDAVRAIRLYRPLVITSVFIGAVTDGHGQHQVSGEIAQEAFRAAADPHVFPEMDLPPWQAQKVYARVPFATVDQRGMYDYATGKWEPAAFRNYVTGAHSTAAPQATVLVPEGDTDPLLDGRSFVQFARAGLALQRTQIGSGMRTPPAGRFDVGYTRYGAAPSLSLPEREKAFFDGLDTSLIGIAALAPHLAANDAGFVRSHLGQIAAALPDAQQQLRSGNMAATADVLARALSLLDEVIARASMSAGLPSVERYNLLHELRVKRVQFNDATLLALGVDLHARIAPAGGAPRPAADVSPAAQPTWLVQGEPFTAEASLHTSIPISGDPPRCELLERFSAPAAPPRPLACGNPADPASPTWTVHGSTPPGATPTRPPFTRSSPEQPVYDVADPRLRNAPLAPSPLVARVTLQHNGVALDREEVVGAELDGAYQPALIVPAVSILINPPAGVVPLTEHSFALTAHVRALGSALSGTAQLQPPSGWQVTPARGSWTAPAPGDDSAVVFTLAPGALASGHSYRISAVATGGSREFSSGFETVGYPGITRDNLFRPATYRAEGVSVTVPPNLRVAYLPGTGDSVAVSLANIGIHPTTVSVADIAAGRLKGYDALLLGVRAYAAHKDLPSVTAQLLGFAREGGAVVLQYNSAEYDGNYGPYPYSLTGSAEKVVEEAAPVRLVDPASQVLSWPNRISPQDFAGWVEERGHGFMRSWDSHYVAPTEVHDAGQDPQRGGLLIAPVGKGAYVYCAFALYRQMPAGVPGSFRLMTNLLSLSRHPQGPTTTATR